MPRNTLPDDEKASRMSYTANEMYHIFLNLVALETVGDANGSIGLRHVVLTVAEQDEYYAGLLKRAEQMAANNETVTSPPTIIRSLLAYPAIHALFVLMAREIQEESASLGFRLLVARLADKKPYNAYQKEGGGKEGPPEIEEIAWPDHKAYSTTYTVTESVWDFVGWLGEGNRGAGVRRMVSHLVRVDKRIGELWREAEPVADDVAQMLDAMRDSTRVKAHVKELVKGHPSARTLLEWRLDNPEAFATALASIL